MDVGAFITGLLDTFGFRTHIFTVNLNDLTLELNRDEKQDDKMCACHSLKDRVVRVVGVAHGVGSSQQHLKRDIWDQSSQLLQPLPGTLR